MSKSLKYTLYTFIGMFFVFVILPAIVIIPASFSNSGLFVFPPKEFTIDHYIKLFQDTKIIQSLLLSIGIGFASTIIAVIIGICASLGIEKGNLPMKSFLESLFLGPLIIPLVTAGIGFLMVFVPLGILGTPISIILAHSIIISPYIIRISLANLKYLNPALEEAGYVHGGSTFTVFRRIIIPQMLPGVFAGSILSFLVSLDEFTVTIFLTTVNTVTLPIRIFQYVTLDINPVVAAIGSFVIIISFILIMILEKKFKIHRFLEL